MVNTWCAKLRSEGLPPLPLDEVGLLASGLGLLLQFQEFPLSPPLLLRVCEQLLGEGLAAQLPCQPTRVEVRGTAYDRSNLRRLERRERENIQKMKNPRTFSA
jgi:hypothetical protein